MTRSQRTTESLAGEMRLFGRKHTRVLWERRVGFMDSPEELRRPIGAGRTAEVFAWGDGQILKLYRTDVPREWVGREAEVGRIVADAGLAAPAGCVACAPGNAKANRTKSAK